MNAEYVNNEPKPSPSLIDEKIKEDIRKYVEQGTGAIDSRIREIDHKWDIDHTAQINAALLILGGFLLYKNNKRWATLSIFATAIIAQHIIMGSCFPVKLLRMFGMRSRKELEKEKFALKALRGDFDNIRHDIEKAWEAVKEKESDKRPIGFRSDNTR
jgi:hypothetical protein